MKIIFLKDSSGNGRKGEVKDVSDGFAKNFLIAKGFAQAVTPQLQQKLEKESREQAEKQRRDSARQQALKADIEKRVFPIHVKVGEKGQVFGGVHEKEVAKAIAEKLGAVIEKNQVEISAPIKTPGEHVVLVKLASGITARARINLEPAN
ncbi:MAG: 50S ribosomal protein L9 [Patescibacteria group bacterium]|nr:50S ribosomal protein L9 [Patescibacteria group bacterium]